MLVIKEDVNLQILEKYGFKESEKTWDYWDGVRKIIIYRNTRKITLNSPCNNSYDVLFDLISDKLVEKVPYVPQGTKARRKQELEKEIEYLKEIISTKNRIIESFEKGEMIPNNGTWKISDRVGGRISE